MRLLLSTVLMMSSLASADRTAFVLAPDLNRAEQVFIGTVTSTKSGARATVSEVLKGALKKGQTLDGRLQFVAYAVARAPKGTQLVVVTGGEFATFPLSSFAAKWARPTLALLGAETSIAAFQLKIAPRETVRELLEQVFGHELIPAAVREAALREVLSRATASWDADFVSLPPALRLPSLVAPFLEYFGRFPRENFRSPARWLVFQQLASPGATPWLLAELETIRVNEEVNVAGHALDALTASDPRAARCALERVRAEGGLWLSRDDDGAVAFRLETLPPQACPPVTFRKDLPLPSGKDALLTVRKLGFFSDNETQVMPLIEASRDLADQQLAEAALHAAGRIATRVKPPLTTFAAAFAKEFQTRGAPIMHGASASFSRLMKHDPALLEWLLVHPTPMSGDYGKPDDLLDAVLFQLDYSDAAFAERVLRRLVGVGKVFNLQTLSKAQPVLTRKVLGEVLRKDPVLALELSGSAGIGSIALEEVARLATDNSGDVRAAALQTLFVHVAGSEEYSRAVPYFPLMLDALTDVDSRVPPIARTLVVQLAVKGQLPQYQSRTPELTGLLPAVLNRTKSARGAKRVQLLAAVKAFPDELFVGELAVQRAAVERAPSP